VSTESEDVGWGEDRNTWKAVLMSSVRYIFMEKLSTVIGVRK
jgi:hypothetical protein